MSILHRYIFKELVHFLMIFVMIFMVIIIAKESYDTRDEIIEQSPAATDVIQYIALLIPSSLVEALPLIVLFSVLFALGLFAKNNEILAMVAAGASPRYLMIPAAVFGLLTTGFDFWLMAHVAPRAQFHAQYIYEVKIKGESSLRIHSKNNIFQKGEGRLFYLMSNFNSLTKVMTHPTILERNEDGGGLVQRIEADTARYDEADDVWIFEGMERWSFDENKSITSFEQFDQPKKLKLEEKLQNILSQEKKPDEMTLTEISEYRDILVRQGGSAQLPFYRTIFQARHSQPFSCFVLALIGFAIASDLHTRRFVLAFAIGLAIGISYFVVNEAILGLGSGGLTAPIVAAWAPVVLYGLLVAALIRRLSTVH